MLFDEINIDTITKNGELYVSVPQLASHLAKAVQAFAIESRQLSLIVPLTEEESTFIMGLVNGMQNVVMMLSQGNSESKISNINTVEELLERFKNDE
jgi:hypothetical protein